VNHCSIRGSDGEWMRGFARKFGICSAYVVELWGVFEGLRLVRKLSFTVVELNTDSLLEMDWKVVLKHTYRETNQCADVLGSCRDALKDEYCYYEIE
jgi:ribonuclease HI